MGQPLCCSAAIADVSGERGYGDGSTPTHDSAVSLCFHGLRLPSTDISHRSLLPHIRLIRLSTVNSPPCPGIASQSLNSSCQPLHYLGYVWLWQGLSDSHSIQAATDQFSAVQSCWTICHPVDCSTPGLPVHHQPPDSCLLS